MNAIAEAGIATPQIVWRDVLHEGPVVDAPDADMLECRARFIAAMKWAPFERARAQLEARDRGFAEALSHADEVVLWFEHDLYDQLQRLQALDMVARAFRRRATVTEVQVDDYLGTMQATALREAYAQRVMVSEATAALGRRAWRAFANDNPARLEAILDEDLCASPYLASAIRRWREEFPRIDDGLSRTERQVLDALARGIFRTKDLYVAACHHAESAIFASDSVFASILCRLAAGPRPLLAHPDQRAVSMPESDRDTRVFWEDALLITRAGRDVLAGATDWMRDAPTRWLGGVRLQGTSGWRWNAAANGLQQGSSR
ncbi:MAG: hypothetical protein H7125_11755 [Proteobacteria bacterium]|nr:hypothetical protein [Burkholderiales bacterium]